MMAKMCFDMAMCAVRAIFWYVKLWYGNMRSYGNALTFNIAILEHGNVMIWQCALLWQCFDIWYGNTLIWQCEHLRQCALIWQYLDMAMFWYGNVHSYGNATELTGSTATCLLIKVIVICISIAISIALIFVSSTTCTIKYFCHSDHHHPFIMVRMISMAR